MTLHSLISGLRDASWLNAQRCRGYLIILATMSGLGAVIYLASASPPNDAFGKPLGTDFTSFWTASHIALTNSPAAVWNVNVHRAAEAAAFGSKAGYAAFFYPPPFLLICLPLALAPYLVSLAVWLAVTGLAWAAMARAWLGRRYGWLPILAFPAVLVNAGHGQNGFLTAALFGVGVLICDKRPWLGGALLGGLIIKPHLAVLIPVFFIFTKNWRGFVAAGLSATALCLLALIVLGAPAWRGFLGTSALARFALEQDLVGYAKMQSPFAAARLLGLCVAAAWLTQMVFALCGVLAIWRLRRCGQLRARGAALVCATLLTTPFLLDYDLTLLAAPLAWLFVEGVETGFLGWERLALLSGYLLPLASRTIAMTAHIPAAPLVIIALLGCIVRRAAPRRSDQSPTSRPASASLTTTPTTSIPRTCWRSFMGTISSWSRKCAGFTSCATPTRTWPPPA